MKNKRGGEDIWKLVNLIIGLALLGGVIVFLLVVLFPGLRQFGETGTGIFDALKGIKVSYGTDADKKPVEAPEDLMGKVKDCEVNIKELEKIKDEQVKGKQGLVVFEFCIGENKCEKADSVLDKLNDVGPKDAQYFELVKCYIGIIEEDKAKVAAEKITIGYEKKKAALLLGAAEHLQEIRSLYVNALKFYLVQKDNQKAAMNFNDIKAKIDNFFNKDAQNVPEAIFEYRAASDFWINKIDGDCSLLADLQTDRKLKFPFVGLSDSYGGEEIKLRALYASINCHIDKKDITKATSSTKKIVALYGKEDYDIGANAKKLVDDIINKYDIASSRFAGCADIGDDEEKCNTFNEDILGTDRSRFSEKLYTEKKCYFFDQPQSIWDFCAPCTEIKKCEDYNDKSPCEADPCNIASPGTECYDAGNVIDDCRSRPRP